MICLTRIDLLLNLVYRKESDTDMQQQQVGHSLVVLPL